MAINKLISKIDTSIKYEKNNIYMNNINLFKFSNQSYSNLTCLNLLWQPHDSQSEEYCHNNMRDQE